MSRHRAIADRRQRRRRRVVAGLLGFLLVGTGAFAAGNWIVGLNSGSSGQAKSATIANLTITATAAPAPGALLYPGGNGDVVLTISNANPFPVTITALTLPSSTTYATGYSDSSLSTPQSGCSAATPSGVTWTFATAGTSSHVLTTAITVAANGSSDNPLTVTLTNASTMSASAPAACAATYFQMPSLAGITATAGGTATTSPATTSWTS